MINWMVDFRTTRPPESSTDRLTSVFQVVQWIMNARDGTDLDLIFAALADQTRRALLTTLMAGDRPVGALAAPHAMSLAAISKHLQILARAGLVVQERSGRVVTCRLLPDGLRTAGIWLQGIGGFDAEDYDALERLLLATLAEEELGGEARDQ